jgi:hypothetical protein
MPDDFGDLAVNTRVHTYHQYAHTRLRVRLAPGIPHALIGRIFYARLGRIAPRGRGPVSFVGCLKFESENLRPQQIG